MHINNTNQNTIYNNLDQFKNNNLIQTCNNLITLLHNTKQNVSTKLSFFRSNFKKSGEEKIRNIDYSITQLETIKRYLHQNILNVNEYKQYETEIINIFNNIKNTLNEQRSNLFQTKETKSFSYFKNNYHNALLLYSTLNINNKTLSELINNFSPFINKNANNLIKQLANHIQLKISSLTLHNIKINLFDIENTINTYCNKNEEFCPEELLNEIICNIFLQLENHTIDEKFQTFTTEDLSYQLDSLLTNKNICPNIQNILILNYLSNLKNSLNGINDISINLNQLESLYKEFLIINQNKDNIFINKLRVFFTKFIIEINLANLLLENNIQYTYNVNIMEAIRNFRVNAYNLIRKKFNYNKKLEEVQFDKFFITKIDEQDRILGKNLISESLPYSITHYYQLYDHIINNSNNEELNLSIHKLKQSFNENLEKLNKKSIFNAINKITIINNELQYDNNKIIITDLGNQITENINKYKIKNRNNLNLDILHKKDREKKLTKPIFLTNYFASIISLQHRRIIINQLFNTKNHNELNLIYNILINIQLNDNNSRLFKQNNNLFEWYGYQTLISLSDLNAALGDLFIKQNNKNNNTKIQITPLRTHCNNLINLLKNTKNQISYKFAYLNNNFKNLGKIKEENINKYIKKLENILYTMDNTASYSSYNNKYIEYKKVINEIINNIMNELNQKRFVLFPKKQTKSFNHFKAGYRKLLMQYFINDNIQSYSLKAIISNILFINENDKEKLDQLAEQINIKIQSLNLNNIKISKEVIIGIISNYLTNNKNKNVEGLLSAILNEIFLEKNNTKNQIEFEKFTSDQLIEQLDLTLKSINSAGECHYLKNLRILNYLSNFKNSLNDINYIYINLNQLKSLYKKFLNMNQIENNIFINNLRILFTEFIIEINIHNLLSGENLKHTYYLSLIEAINDFQTQVYNYIKSDSKDDGRNPIQLYNNIIQKIISVNKGNSLENINEASNEKEYSSLLNDSIMNLNTIIRNNEIENDKPTLKNNQKEIYNEYSLILDDININNDEQNSEDNISENFNFISNKNDNNESFHSILGDFENIEANLILKIKPLYNLLITNLTNINNIYKKINGDDKFNQISLEPSTIIEKFNNIILALNANNFKEEKKINLNILYNQENIIDLKNIINARHLKLIGNNLFNTNQNHLINEIITSINFIENNPDISKMYKYDLDNFMNKLEIKNCLLNLMQKNENSLNDSLETIKDNYVNHNFSILFPVINNKDKDNNQSNLVLSMLPINPVDFNNTVVHHK